MKPTRIQLSRRKGWRMPPNTVKVDRSTKWGNPFIVGQHGGRAYCVQLYQALLAGHLYVSANDQEQLLPGSLPARGLSRSEAAAYIGISPIPLERYRQMVIDHIGDLRGKNLACWCPLTVPCHADTLLAIANKGHQQQEAPNE